MKGVTFFLIFNIVAGSLWAALLFGAHSAIRLILPALPAPSVLWASTDAVAWVLGAASGHAIRYLRQRQEIQ